MNGSTFSDEQLLPDEHLVKLLESHGLCLPRCWGLANPGDPDAAAMLRKLRGFAMDATLAINLRRAYGLPS